VCLPIFITYFIAAAGFMHIVAGSVEAFFRYQKGDSTSKQWP
jgi:hypothetical protein